MWHQEMKLKGWIVALVSRIVSWRRVQPEKLWLTKTYLENQTFPLQEAHMHSPCPSRFAAENLMGAQRSHALQHLLLLCTHHPYGRSSATSPSCQGHQACNHQL